VRPRRAQLVAALFVIVAGVVINQSAVHWRANSADSDLFAYYGWCVSQGARPYLDVWDNKPPGIWWVNAAAVRIAGVGVASDLLLGATALLVSLGAFVAGARTIYHRDILLPAAVVGVLLLTDQRFECGANRTETWVVGLEAAGVAAYVRWLRTRRPPWLLVAGLCAGTAPLFKQSGLAAAGAIGLHWVWMQLVTARRADPQRGRTGQTSRFVQACVLCAALAVPAALAGGALAAQGALGEAAFAVGRFNRAYFAIRDATWLDLGPAWRAAAPALLPLAPVAALALLGLLPTIWRRTSPRLGPPRRGAGIVAVWLLLAAYLALAGPGRRGHHFMPLLAPLGLLALAPLHLLAGRHGLRRALTARPTAAAALVVYGFALVLFALGNGPALARAWAVKPSWYALSYARPTDEQLRAAEVIRRTRPDESIYVWGWSPGTYRWAARRAASRFATVEKFGQVGAPARFIVDGAAEDIVRSEPRLIFLSPHDYDGIVAKDPGEFGRWLRDHYHLGPNIAGMYLLERRSAVGP
jgi:hypothetical protein